MERPITTDIPFGKLLVCPLPDPGIPGRIHLLLIYAESLNGQLWVLGSVPLGQKPPLGKKIDLDRLHRENCPVSRGGCWEKSVGEYDDTSGVTIFANGAAFAAFASILQEGLAKANKNLGGDDGNSTQLEDSDVQITTTEVVDENGNVIKRRVSITGTYQDKSGLGVGDILEDSVESAFSGSFDDASEGITYELTTDLEKLGSDLQSLLKGADVTVKVGQCTEDVACAGGGLIIVDKDNLKYFINNSRTVLSHEFGHLAGFPHGNFLSRYGAFSPSLESVKALYNRYNLD